MGIFDGIFGKKQGELLKGDLVTKSVKQFRENNNDFKRSKESYNLRSIKDTYEGISWNDFIELIESNDFKEGLRYKKYRKASCREVEKIHTEEAAIFYNTKNGLIIWATSFSEKGIHILNGGKLYGMIDNSKPSKESYEKIKETLIGCSHDILSNEKIDFSYDIRKGLIYTINELEKNTKLLPKWGENTQSLNFVDYIESKNEGYDYKKITESKIRKLPQEAQDIISLPQEESKNIIDVEFTEVGK